MRREHVTDSTGGPDSIDGLRSWIFKIRVKAEGPGNHGVAGSGGGGVRGPQPSHPPQDSPQSGGGDDKCRLFFT